MTHAMCTEPNQIAVLDCFEDSVSVKSEVVFYQYVFWLCLSIVDKNSVHDIHCSYIEHEIPREGCTCNRYVFQ